MTIIRKNDTDVIFMETVLKNVTNFIGKHLRWILLIVKLLMFYLKRSPSQAFSCEFLKYFRTEFL